jgi:hypothetical protein
MTRQISILKSFSHEMNIYSILKTSSIQSVPFCISADSFYHFMTAFLRRKILQLQKPKLSTSTPPQPPILGGLQRCRFPDKPPITPDTRAPVYTSKEELPRLLQAGKLFPPQAQRSLFPSLPVPVFPLFKSNFRRIAACHPAP